MNVTLNERDAILKMMNYIEEERNRLFSQYSILLDRLRELDKIDNTTLLAEKQTVEEDLAFRPLEPNEVDKLPTDIFNLSELSAKANNEMIKTEEEEVVRRHGQTAVSVHQKTKTKNHNLELVAKEITEILKEISGEVKTSVIIKCLRDRGLDAKNPYQLIKKAIALEPNIEKASHGFYRYKW